MTTTAVTGNPVMMGLAVLVVLFPVLALRAWLMGRRDDAKDTYRRIEPGLDRRHDEPAADAGRPDGFGDGPRQISVRRFGFTPVALAFLAGAMAGSVGLPAAMPYAAGPMDKVLAKIELLLAETLDEVDPTTVAAVEPPDVSAPAEPERKTLSRFVDSLQRELPRQVDETTTLVSANAEDRVVTLGHRVSRVMSDVEAGAFAEAAKNRIVASTCPAEAGSEIGDFNKRGVEFRFVYADAIGKTIAAITLEPAFCDHAR